MPTINTKLPITVTGKASLVRPQFSQGLLLQDDDLNQIVDYMRNMSRLLFQTVLGCGVLCGFKVTASILCGKLQINVAKGVALDCRGDLVELPDIQTIEFDPTCGTDIPPEIWVAICRREQPCAPRDAMCSLQDGDVSSAYTRIRDGYEIQILDSQPTGYCGCKPASSDKNAETVTEPLQRDAGNCCDFIAKPDDVCYKDHYQGVCECDCGCGDCIVLARVTYNKAKETTPDNPKVDHSVRRFVRPVLMRDPLLEPRVKIASPSSSKGLPTSETSGGEFPKKSKGR